MQRTFLSFFSRAKGVAGGFSAAQRTVTIIGIAVLVLGAVALGSWLTRPTLTPLFSGLSAADASTIVEQLRSSNVQFELTNGGSTILVPESDVYSQRLAAAAAGMPSSSTGGYALLDDMGVTTSEFQQSVTYKRALEGELAATIGAMKGVKVASVKLAIPEETVFVSSKQDPTASVFVETQNGITLTSDQVTAIVHLTSASIEGMKPTGVAVIDAEGNVLSAVGTGTTGGSDKQTSAYEGRVQSAVQVMLDRIVGPGNSTVAVAATISSESAEVLTETFSQTPDVAPLTETRDTETYAGTGGGGGTGTGGVLGPDNIAVPNGATGNGNYNSEKTVRDNAVNKVSETRTVPAGAVARQTVSVAVNKDASPGISNAEIAELVTAAAGIDATRGDAVTVKTVEFNTAAATGATAALAAAEEAATADRIAELIRTGIIVLGIAIPAILALILFVRRSKQERTPIELDGIELPTEVLPAIPTRAIEVPQPVDLVEPEPSSMDLNRRSISQLASQNPEKTAALLRGLMDERVDA